MPPADNEGQDTRQRREGRWRAFGGYGGWGQARARRTWGRRGTTEDSDRVEKGAATAQGAVALLYQTETAAAAQRLEDNQRVRHLVWLQFHRKPCH
jgi:hypothetical protein